MKFNLQLSESERSICRDKMLRVFEAAKALGMEAGAAVADGRRAVEHEKRNSFIVEEVVGQLQVGLWLLMSELSGKVGTLSCLWCCCLAFPP